MKLVQSICFVALTILAVSCSDDSGLSLNLTSPNDGASFTGGQSINVAGLATDDVAVASLIIDIPELSINQTLPANNTPSQDFTFTIDIALGTPPMEEINISVTAVDNEGNQESDERQISIQ